MSKLLLEVLDNSGLLEGQKPGVEALERYSKTQLLDLLNQAVELTSPTDLPREKSIFVQSASLSLGGGRQPCANIQCRLQHAEQLAQYAALYAEKIYIYNHLAYHLTRHDDPGEEELKIDLFNDLSVFGFLRPLIEAEVISPIIPPEGFCPNCFVSQLVSGTIKGKIRSVEHWLKNKYLEETQATLERKGNTYTLSVTGPELLLEHGGILFAMEKLPKGLANKRQIMAAVGAGGIAKLSRAVRERTLKLPDMLTDRIMQNVFFEIACAQCLGTSFVTERELHIDLLNKLSADTRLANRNQLVQRHLTALVPFLGSARVEDLLKLRQREPEAFVVFRSALTRAIEEYRSSRGGRFGKADAKQLYGDVIAPSVAKLDQAFKGSIRNVLKGSAAKVVAWAGAITFGIYAGFLPGELAQVAAVLGLTHVLADIGEPLVSLGYKKHEIASGEMYFLWRVRQLSR